MFHLSTRSFTWGECMEHVMSKSFQPTRLVGAIAIAMGCSPVILLKMQQMQLSLTQLLSLLQKVLKKPVKFQRVFL